MSPTFTEEILDHIFGLVSRDGCRGGIKGLISLCLANKVLLSISQSHLYRDITICSHTVRPYLDHVSEYEAIYTRTRLLVRTILDNPLLGTQIQKLVLCFTGEPNVDDQYTASIATTLGSTNRVRNLKLICDWDYGSSRIKFSSIESAFGSHALAALVSSPSLERLTLKKIENCSLYMVPSTPVLRHLELVGTTSSTESAHDVAISTDGPAHLNSLKIDIQSANERNNSFEDRLYRAEDIETLDVGLPNTLTEGGMHGWKPFILGKLKRLRYLHWRTKNMSFASHRRYDFCHLRHLNRASLLTLPHLTVSIDHTLLLHGLAIKNPCACVWDDVLTQLPQIETFFIFMLIEGDLDFDVSGSLGEEWGTLPNAIYSDPRTCTSLKEFRVDLVVQVDDKEVKEEVAGAKAFLEGFTKTTYPRYIHPGRYAEIVERHISFSFKIQFELGKRSEPYFYDEHSR